ncbi:MAG: aspartyl-phosphate phosphatase Spo0E family protein [Clostridiales bacterium]|jgi:nitric oxide reductase activation protein|nr:aspartyl-phosphate phosphatase Spo0E family protein [Clostridiales bacterium]
MKQEEVKSSLRDQIDNLRKRLNREIEKNNFDLSAPSVMRASDELDQFIVQQQRYLISKRDLTNVP